MSKFANLCDPITDEKNGVFADRCTDADRGKPYTCPSCGVRVWLCKKKRFYFSGRHTSDCDIDNDSHEPAIHITTRYRITPKALLSAVDRPIQGPPPDGIEPPPPPSEQDPADYNPRLVRGPKTLHSAREYYAHLWHLPLDTSISDDGMSTLGDLVINSENFQACRQSGIDRQIRLVKVRKTKWHSLPSALQVSGCLTFRDAYSKSTENAVFFLVKLSEKTQHDYFFRLLTGDIGRRYKRPYLVLLGEWQRLSNCPFHAYFAQINSNSYHFVDDLL